MYAIRSYYVAAMRAHFGERFQDALIELSATASEACDHEEEASKRLTTTPE